jgi:hypothetical protein
VRIKHFLIHSRARLNVAADGSKQSLNESGRAHGEGW